MKVTTHTDSVLTIKAGARNRLIILGCLVVLFGLIVVGIGWTGLLRGFDIEPPVLSRIQQIYLGEQSKDRPTSGEITVQFTYYTGRILFARQRLFFAIGNLAIVVGLVLLIESQWYRIITIDKSNQSINVKTRVRIWHSRKDTYLIKDLVGVEVERKPDSDAKGANYRVILLIAKDKGIPLTPNYVHYTEVLPLCMYYRQHQQDAKGMADTIRQFVIAELAGFTDVITE